MNEIKGSLGALIALIIVLIVVWLIVKNTSKVYLLPSQMADKKPQRIIRAEALPEAPTGKENEIENLLKEV